MNNTTDCLSLSADSSMLSTTTTSKSLLKSCDESGLDCDHHGTVMSNSNPIATTSSSSIQTASSSKKTTAPQHYHTLHHTNPTTGSGNSSSTKTGSTSSSSTSAGGLTATSSLKKHLNILRGSGAKKTESVSSSSSSAGSKPTTAAPANPTPQTSVIGSFITSTSSSITSNGNLMPPPTHTAHSPVSSMNSNSSLNSKLVEYEGKINDLNIELSKYQHNRSVLK